MKKLHYIFALFVTTFLFIACQPSKSVEKPEDMGTYAFNMLKKLDDMSKDDYIKTIFTVEEVKEFGKKNADKISERGKKEIASLTAEDYNARMERDFNSIIEDGKEYGIVWKNIQYSDYTFEAKEEDNIAGTKGKVLFKHNDTTYAVGVSALIVDAGYRLIRLSRLTEN